jgi:cytochrome P450
VSRAARPGRPLGPAAARVPGGLPGALPDPYRFDPSRFASRPQPFTWIPFGGGRRRCIGAAFAAMEMEAVLSRAKSLSLEPVGDAERFVRRGMVVAPGRGGRVRVA